MNKNRKLITLSCLGSILEYYDFIIYGMMVIYLSDIFFRDTSPEVAYLKTFSVLAIGYLARPIGGYLFGLFSDRYGRKKTFLFIMFLMAFATFMIGLLPTYEQVGILAPILLTIARVLQGLSFGAEMPSVTTIIKENTPDAASGKYFGYIMSSTAIGTLMASMMLTFISRFEAAEIMAGVWRIPFIFGGILALIVLIMRSRIEETEEFLSHAKKLHQSSVNLTLDLFRNHWQAMLLGLASTLFFSYLILFSLYLPIYLNQYFHFSKQMIFSTMTWSILISVVFSPLFGHWFNRFNRVRVLKIISLLFLLFLSFSLSLLKTGSGLSLFIFLFGYQFVISAYATNNLALLSKLFPLNLRVTGIGLCYNLAFSIASLIPLILTQNIEKHNYDSLVVIFSTLLVLGIIFVQKKMRFDFLKF